MNRRQLLKGIVHGATGAAVASMCVGSQVDDAAPHEQKMNIFLAAPDNEIEKRIVEIYRANSKLRQTLRQDILG